MSRPKPVLTSVTVQASQLLRGIDTLIVLPFPSDFLFCPKSVPSQGGVGWTWNGDSTEAIYGVRINDAGGLQLPFDNSGDGYGLAVFEGTVTQFYICKLGDAVGNEAAVLPLVFYVGTDCDLGTTEGVY
jgi:hypothetical protein